MGNLEGQDVEVAEWAECFFTVSESALELAEIDGWSRTWRGQGLRRRALSIWIFAANLAKGRDAGGADAWASFSFSLFLVSFLLDFYHRSLALLIYFSQFLVLKVLLWIYNIELSFGLRGVRKWIVHYGPIYNLHIHSMYNVLFNNKKIRYN